MVDKSPVLNETVAGFGYKNGVGFQNQFECLLCIFGYNRCSNALLSVGLII